MKQIVEYNYQGKSGRTTIHPYKDGTHYSKDYVFIEQEGAWKVVRPLYEHERRELYPNYYRGSNKTVNRVTRNFYIDTDLDEAMKDLPNKSNFVNEAIRQRLKSRKK